VARERDEERDGGAPLTEGDLIARLRPNREIVGMSAILLPFRPDGAVDWGGFEAHLARTIDAGLVPAVNMDTGYVQLIDDATRTDVLGRASKLCAGLRFVAGAFVADEAGDSYDADGYVATTSAIAEAGGTPIVFPSWGLHGLSDDAWVDAHAALGDRVGDLLAFELGPMFVPNGRILSLDAYRRLLGVPRCVGAKHSSLSRRLEWDRLAARDADRPDFQVLTGNDLAIDLVMWGSDYLLGLSTFAPDAFALRDRMWRDGDPEFHQLNDLLQELGAFTFRSPVPGYRHDAAMFLQLRGWLDHDGVAPGAVTRPESDRAVLADLAARIEDWVR
jgi:dihydrodipicolinate synthase/N-acetylneuraminate lyase